MENLCVSKRVQQHGCVATPEMYINEEGEEGLGGVHKSLSSVPLRLPSSMTPASLAHKNLPTRLPATPMFLRVYKFNVSPETLV